MGQPVVHFEIIGTDPEALRRYYNELFEWEFDTSGAVASTVSEAGQYGFVEAADDIGIPGGVGGGPGYRPRVIFYVGVPDVEAALQKAERLGGKRTTHPERVGGTDLVVAHFTDPEGHLVGLASVWEPHDGTAAWTHLEPHRAA
jgi:predicted enzyme related to lactoylglutathione lyase